MSLQADRGQDAWTVSALTDLADVVMGQSPPGSTYNTTGQGLPFFQGKAEFGDDYPTVRKWCTRPTRIAEPGDILMSVRAPVGPTNVANQRCGVGRGLAIIRPKAGVPGSLLRHSIRLQVDEIASWGTGTTFTAINKHHFAQIQVPLPPQPMRAALAELLDNGDVLQRSSSVHLAAARQAVDRFRGVVLAAACTGRLTASWRDENSDAESVEHALLELKERRGAKRRTPTEEPLELPLPELPPSYVVGTIGRAALVVEYGTSKKCDANSAGVPVIRMGNIQDGALDLTDLKYCSPDSQIERLVLEDGDLLFNRTNSPELVGKSAVFHEPATMSFASYLIRVRLSPDVADPDFVNYWINSAWGRAWAATTKTDGVSQSNINGTKLAAMPLPLPPIEEQHAIVRRASAMLSLADGLLARIDAAARKVERGSRAVAAKAFRGEFSAAEPLEV